MAGQRSALAMNVPLFPARHAVIDTAGRGLVPLAGLDPPEPEEARAKLRAPLGRPARVVA